MTDSAGRGGEWFAAGGDDYAAYRPDYPADVASFVAEAAPDTERAVDVGCGTGQFTRQLAAHFDEVIGVDPSADQIGHAEPGAGIDYRVGGADHLPVPDASVSAVTAAQAAHWFDLDAFYRQVRRVAVPGALLALISYGAVVLDDDLAARFDRFYTDEIGRYWPPERRHVDAAYATLDFPFTRIDAPSPVIERDWTLDQFIGYLTTWSATRRAREAGDAQSLTRLRDDLAAGWGGGTRRVRWPVTLLAAQLP
ncbi:class I SAM-dependent methyltransferase [Gordonia sp. VNK21]|uniref:class I SAM-dependent methyltransferase n=1 Tax=Gordonia sp. VNK21 TaxID=3382483 RepID=UPI0038D45A73